MNWRSRSSLFLMEQLIVIAIFAVCAAVCVKISIGSFLMANDTRDVNRALVAAKGGAECYKAYGDLKKTAASLAGSEYSFDGDGMAVVVYYDAGWRTCGKTEAAYALRLVELRGVNATGGNFTLPPLCKLSVGKTTGEEIVGFTVAARRQVSFQNDTAAARNILSGSGAVTK